MSQQAHAEGDAKHQLQLDAERLNNNESLHFIVVHGCTTHAAASLHTRCNHKYLFLQQHQAVYIHICRHNTAVYGGIFAAKHQAVHTMQVGSRSGMTCI